MLKPTEEWTYSPEPAKMEFNLMEIRALAMLCEKKARTATEETEEGNEARAANEAEFYTRLARRFRHHDR